MPDVLDWKQVGDRPAALRRAAEALRSGGLVAFPTETVYGIAASPRSEQGILRLFQSKGRPIDKPVALAIPDGRVLSLIQPNPAHLARRLARRCWPGPLTIVLTVEEAARQSLASEFAPQIWDLLMPRSSLGLRLPAHEAILSVMDELGPLALTSANLSGQAAAVTGAEALAAIGSEVEVVIDDGPCRFGHSSTVVNVQESSWHVLREGVITQAQLQQCSATILAFLCTGNTCRSPMAEALCKWRLAERLSCPVEDLPKRGFVVLSAGLAAAVDSTAAVEAIEAAREFGADLSAHRSRAVSRPLMSQADYLICMTKAHAEALEMYPDLLGTRPRLLALDGSDIDDPIGCDKDVYRECARRILHHLDQLLTELLPS